MSLHKILSAFKAQTIFQLHLSHSETRCCNAQPVTKVCLQCFTEIFQQMLPLPFSLHISKNDSDKTTAVSCLLAEGCQLDWDSYLTKIIKLSKYLKLELFLESSSLNKVTFTTMRLATYFGKLQNFMKLN